jgi:hypothetical protein
MMYKDANHSFHQEWEDYQQTRAQELEITLGAVV